MTKSDAIELIKQLNKWRQFLASRGDSDSQAYLDAGKVIDDLLRNFLM